jgi:DNA repair protein RecO (recombination protein O)
MPLEPFRPLRVSWSGRGELFTLTAAEGDGPAMRPAGEVLMSMFYVNELVLRLTGKQDPHPGLFDGYAMTITRLNAGDDQANCLRRFEKRLLDELGYGLNLATDVDGRPVDSSEQYFYELEHGPRRVGGGTGGQLTVSGDTLLAIEAGRFENTNQRREARRLLTAAIDRYLGGRPLRTRQVLNALRARSG